MPSRYMVKHQETWDDWVSLNTTVEHKIFSDAFSFCFPITSLFPLRRNYIWGHNNSCFWSFVEVLEWYAPPCRHGLPLIPWPIKLTFSTASQNLNPIYWLWGSMNCQICLWILVDSPPFVVNRWLLVRFNLLSSVIVGVTGIMCLVTPSISASTAGFALAFASMVTSNLLTLVCFEWRWLWTIFKVELLLGYKICRTWTIYGMTFPLDICCISGVSYLPLGRLRTR